MNERPCKIEFRDVRMRYGDQVILNGVSFSVAPGEMKVILGKSGSGKSTILRLTIGLMKPDAGEIFVDGEEVTSRTEEELSGIRQHISYVFQEGALFSSMTVFENVAYRPRELGWPEEEIQRRVSDVLAFMDLADVADDLPGDLSGGTQRRVAIARAVVDQPQIILYDEPTVGLDPQTAHKLCEAAIRLRDIEGVTSLFVTHRIDDLRFLASKYMLPSSEGGLEMHDKEDRLCLVNTRFIMLNEGKVIFDGTEEQLYASEDPFLREFTNLDEEP